MSILYNYIIYIIADLGNYCIISEPLQSSGPMQCLVQDVKALTPQLKIPQGLEEQVQKALEEFGIGDLNDENDAAREAAVEMIKACMSWEIIVQLNRLRSYHVAHPSLECTISISEWSPNRNNRNVSAIWKIVGVYGCCIM